MPRNSPAAWLGVADLPMALPFAILQGFLVFGWVLPSAVIPIQALAYFGDAQSVSVFFFGVSFAGLIGAFTMPLLVHWAGRRAVFALGIALLVGASLVMALDGAVYLIVGNALRIFGFLCLDVTFEVSIMERIPRRAFARFEPVRMFAMALGLVVGPWLGVKLSLVAGIWLPFVIVAVMIAVVGVVVLRIRLVEPFREAPIASRAPNPLRFVPRFWRQPRLRLAWALALGRSAWWSMFFIYAPIFCIEGGLGHEMAGVILSVASIPMLFIPLWSRFSRRFGLRQFLATAYLATGIVTMSVAVAADNPWFGVALLLIGALCASLIDTVGNALFLRAVHPHERPEMASVFTTYREIAHLGPPGVFSALLTIFALPSVFLASGLSLVAVTWLTRYIPKRY
jgi:MFS family permease